MSMQDVADVMAFVQRAQSSPQELPIIDFLRLVDWKARSNLVQCNSGNPPHSPINGAGRWPRADIGLSRPATTMEVLRK